MKYNLSKIFKSAWKLVKTTKCTMSTALKKAWAEAKAAVKKGMSVAEYLVAVMGYKVWKKAGKERVYMNGTEDLMVRMGYDRGLAKGYRKVSIYFDCLDGKFYFTGATSSREKTVNDLCNKIRTAAANA